MTLFRRFVVGVLAFALVLGGATSGVPAGAATVPNVGGVALHYLPAGLGEASDFTYDYGHVDFASRVWESRTSDGGYRVDLDVTVMRGARLTSGRALRRWFTAYEQRDPEPSYIPLSVHGSPGYLCDDQVFWLVRPGLAVSAQVDGSRFRSEEVARIAWAATPPAP